MAIFISNTTLRLTDLNGLLALETVGAGRPGQCSIGACEGIAPLLGYDGSDAGGVSGVGGSQTIVSGNRAGCNSSEEVLASYSGQELTRPRLRCFEAPSL